MKIRKARLNDAKQISYLNILLDQWHANLDRFWALKQDTEHIMVQYTKKLITSSDTVIYVAEESDRIIGFILGIVKTNAPIFEVPVIGQVQVAFIVEEFRRQRIGKALVDALFQWFYSKQVKHVEVSSDVRNVLGICAWKKFGFHEAVIKLRLDLNDYAFTAK